MQQEWMSPFPYSLEISSNNIIRSMTVTIHEHDSDIFPSSGCILHLRILSETPSVISTFFYWLLLIEEPELLSSGAHSSSTKAKRRNPTCSWCDTSCLVIQFPIYSLNCPLLGYLLGVSRMPDLRKHRQTGGKNRSECKAREGKKQAWVLKEMGGRPERARCCLMWPAVCLGCWHTPAFSFPAALVSWHPTVRMNMPETVDARCQKLTEWNCDLLSREAKQTWGMSFVGIPGEIEIEAFSKGRGEKQRPRKREGIW